MNCRCLPPLKCRVANSTAREKNDAIEYSHTLIRVLVECGHGLLSCSPDADATRCSEPARCSRRLLVVLVRIRVAAPLVIDVVENSSQKALRVEVLNRMLEKLARSLSRSNDEENLVGQASQDVAVSYRQD